MQEEPLCCSGGAALTHRGRRPAGSNAAALDVHIWASNAGQDTTLDTLLGITLSKKTIAESYTEASSATTFSSRLLLSVEANHLE